MIDLFNIEKQAAKRIHAFLLHKATEENLDVEQLKFILNSKEAKAGLRLHYRQSFIKNLDLKELCDFFGKPYNASTETQVGLVFQQKAEEEKISLDEMNIIVCLHKGTIGTFLYREKYFVKRLSNLELIKHFFLEGGQ